jgi:type IV secretion system protein VirD4
MKDRNEFVRGKPADVSGEQLLSFIFKGVTILIIFIGIQAAAQRFASGAGYDPAWVGEPAHEFTLLGKHVRVYSFWKIFYWTLLYYKRFEIHPLLYSSMRIAGYTSGAAIVFYFLLEFVLIRNRKQNIFGTARWGTEKDLERAGVLRLKGGMILGQLAGAKLSCAYDPVKDSVVLHLKKPAQKIVQSGIYNTLLSAPTRSGKGVSSVIPTLLSYPGSVIVLDFKGENFNLTSGFRSKMGRVYRWEPTGDRGHHFNPMMEIRPGEEAFSDANLIADILTTPASGGRERDGGTFPHGRA